MTNNILTRRLGGALCCAALAAVLTGCGIYKKYDLPTEKSAIVADFDAAAKAAVDSTTLPYLSWDKVFTDSKLQALIREALESNKDLRNAKLNIDIAHAQLLGAKLSYFPAVAFSPNGGSASYGGSHMNWTYSLPLSAQWEIDVFGKILNTKRQARVVLEQSEDYAQAVRSQIISGVATTYYSMVLLQQQLDLTKRTAEIWADQVKTMKSLKNAGSTNEAAVQQSEANYYSILASIPDMEQQLTVLNNTMSLLLNTYPRTWDINTNLDFDLPAGLTSGVPVSYLAARPDVRAAERQMASAYYATASARAAFYPSLTVTAQGGFTNLLGSIITNPGKWFIQLAGQLSAPIFSRGRNIANLKVAKANQQKAMNDFEYAVLSASADVSDALAKIEANSRKRAYLLQQIESLEKAVDYTQTLFVYQSSTTYLEVLTARSSLLQAQLSSLSCWYARAAALISLYQSVGGGC